MMMSIVLKHVEVTDNIYLIKTNLMHYLSSVYYVSQPLHVSGISVAHHQQVYCIYTVYVLMMGYRYARNM
jgi:hypothetical protein